MKSPPNERSRPRGDDSVKIARSEDYTIPPIRKGSLRDQINYLFENTTCECDTYGYCWSCADIERLREALRKAA